MTMRAVLYLILGVLLFTNFTAGSAVAQEPLSEKELKAQPGYVEFGDIWKYSDGEEEVEIHLTQPLLRVVSAFVEEEDPELSTLIRDLHLVKVNAFSFGRADEDEIRDMMDSVTEKLRGDSWDNIVKVRERDERVNVFVRFDGDKSNSKDTFLSGLAVLVFEEDQATFVNVVGHFRLEDVARVGRHFELPHTNEWDKYNKRGDRDDGEHGDGE